jgi:membrane protease YdiL (CAAX protease family)
VLVIFASIYLTFITVNFSQSGDADKIELANNSSILIDLLMFGLIFFILMFIVQGKLTIEKPEGYTSSDATVTAISTFVFLGLEVLIQNLIQTVTLSVISYDYWFFFVSTAIAEAVIFSVMFQIVWEYLTRSPLVGILVHATAFMLYHYAVYGSDPSEMVAVFFSGLIFALSVKFTKKLSIPMITHVIVNVISYGILFNVGG